MDEEYKWLPTGEAAITEMLGAIKNATQSIRLEMYMFRAGSLADEFRDALRQARKRGVSVRVLIDAIGSAYLTDHFWHTCREIGVEVRWFNPISLHQIFIRDHRKLFVCDDSVAMVGGCNIANEYRGDGIKAGWRDLGLLVRGTLVRELAAAFDEMFSCADFKHKPFTRLRKSRRQKTVTVPEARLLLGAPGRNNIIKRSLLADLQNAGEVSIITPYFVPPWKIRMQLRRLARKGAKVRLILPGKSDLTVMRMAAQSFYRRFLRAGVSVYEYQPQILHAKLFIIDDAVYAGSANLDARSLNINYELLIRSTQPRLVSEAREIFDSFLNQSKQIEATSWRRSRTFLNRVKARIARFLVARLDSFFARRQLRWWKISLKKVKAAEKHKTVGSQP
jgi:cardiolipin synthase